MSINQEPNYDDPRLNIINIAMKCNIRLKDDIGSSNGRIYGYCPFCEDKHGKLSLTIESPKGYKNVYKCFHCGAKGSGIKLYSECKGLTNKQAYIDLMNDNNKENIEKTKKIIKKNSEIPKAIEPKEIDYLDKVYRAFLKLLPLYENDYKNLVDRGLDKDTIIKKGYRSLPIDFKTKYQITNKLLKQGFKLEGVPGFYVDKFNKWTYEGYQGYLVPIKTINNKIISMQVRLTQKIGKLRYIYFSSNKEFKGSKAIAGSHFVKGESEPYKIRITEGPLKADIANYFHRGESFIAMPGVNSGVEYVLDYLKELKIKVAVLCFDMDMYENIQVRKALINIIKAINGIGINTTIEKWDREYKGIDDYYKYLNENS